MRPIPPVSLWASCAAALALAFSLGAAAPAQAQVTFWHDDHVRNRPAHIGFSGIGGAQLHTQAPGLPVDGFFDLGFDVIGTLVPGFALGFTRAGIAFGHSSIEGDIFAMHITPTFEFSWFPGSDTQLFVQIGSTVSVTAENRVRPWSADAALTTTLGARFWFGNTFTFGIFFGNDIGLTDRGIVRSLGGPLGQGELSFFGGLEIGWNV